jgi:membrane dipeptidase
MSWQNMRPIGDSLDRIGFFHKLGVRIMQPTYNYRNMMDNGCLELHDEGLSAPGRDAVRIMNQLGVAIDLSHVGERTTLDAIEASERVRAGRVGRVPRQSSYRSRYPFSLV